MNRAELHRRTVALIADILEIEPSAVSGAERLREDLGMDSLGSLELLSSLSAELRVDLDAEAAMDIETVDDAVDFVAAHLPDETPTRAGAT